MQGHQQQGQPGGAGGHVRQGNGGARRQPRGRQQRRWRAAAPPPAVATRQASPRNLMCTQPSSHSGRWAGALMHRRPEGHSAQSCAGHRMLVSSKKIYTTIAGCNDRLAEHKIAIPCTRASALASAPCEGQGPRMGNLALRRSVTPHWRRRMPWSCGHGRKSTVRWPVAVTTASTSAPRRTQCCAAAPPPPRARGPDGNRDSRHSTAPSSSAAASAAAAERHVCCCSGGVNHTAATASCSSPPHLPACKVKQHNVRMNML